MTRSILHSLTAFAFAVLVVFGTAMTTSAQTTFYSDQATFEAANPALDVEDFSGSNAEPGGVCSGPSPLNSGTSDGCFDSGIAAGLELEVVVDGGGGEYAAVGTGLAGSPCAAAGPNSFADEPNLHFSPAVRAAGFNLMTLIPGTGGETFTVDVFGPGGLLGSSAFAAPALPLTVFLGVDTIDPGGITRIEVREDVDVTADLFCDVQFGDDPVPVELISFDAVVNGTDVSLNWATASETNNAGFEVQVLVDEDWNALDFVEGHGTTTEARTYGYTAEDMAVGTHSFRLKQIDFDGAFEYSDELEVTVETPGTHLITRAYPNPFNPQSQFTLAVAQDQRVTVELYNTLGQRVSVLFNGTVEANQAQLVTIDGAGLASGMYIVRVSGERFSDALSVTLLK